MESFECQCCGFAQEFEDGEAAFQAGWDAPPHFTTHVTCPLCPGVGIVMGAGHTKAHADWAAHGRPADFHPKRCALDPQWKL